MTDPTDDYLDEPEEPTQSLPESVVEEIRQSSAQELERFGYQRDDSKTLDIIDNVLNQVRDAVRSTGFQRPAYIESTDFRISGEMPDQDRIDLGTDHLDSQTGALERSDHGRGNPPTEGRRRATASYTRDERKGDRRDQPRDKTERRTRRRQRSGDDPEKTYYDLKFVTELARKHGIAEAKYEALANRMQEQERATGFERVELADTLHGILLDLETIAAQVGDHDAEAGSGLYQAINRVGLIQHRLNEHSREFRERYQIPPGTAADLSSGARAAVLTGDGVDQHLSDGSGVRPLLTGEASRYLDPSSGMRSSNIYAWGEASRQIGEISRSRRSWRRRWTNGRIVKWAVGGSVPLLLVVWFLAASVFPVSETAVVDAPLRSLTAPILGTVYPADVSQGQKIAKGQLLATVRNDQVDTQALDLLRERKLDRQNQQQAVVDERLALERELETLRNEVVAWKQQILAQSEKDLAEQEALLMQSESALVNQQGLLVETERSLVDRVREITGETFEVGQDIDLLRSDLSDEQALMLTNLEQRVVSLRRIVNALELKRNAHQSLRNRLQARYQSLLEGQYTFGESPPHGGRIELIEGNIQSLSRSFARLDGEVADITKQIEAEEAEVQRKREAHIYSAQAGILWRQHAGQGHRVSAGDRVASMADDQSCRIHAWMSGAASASIRVGQAAYIYVIDSGARLTGTVSMVGLHGDEGEIALQRIGGQAPYGTAAIEVAVDNTRQLESYLGQEVRILVADSQQGFAGRLLLHFRMWLEFSS